MEKETKKNMLLSQTSVGSEDLLNSLYGVLNFLRFYDVDNVPLPRQDRQLLNQLIMT